MAPADKGPRELKHARYPVALDIEGAARAHGYTHRQTSQFLADLACKALGREDLVWGPGKNQGEQQLELKDAG